MKSIINCINHPKESFTDSIQSVSWLFVALTILANSVLAPILHLLFSENPYSFSALLMLKLTFFGILSYLLICLAFWVVCKCFGSQVSLGQHIASWGISYPPTALCSILVAFTEVFFFIFWNNTIWGMLVTILFIGILIWKAILYFIYLREFANLKGVRFLGACLIIGLIILLMAPLNGYFGLMTPVL